MKYELIKIRQRGGLQIYLRVLGVCPKINLHSYLQRICGLNGVSRTIVHNTPVRVWQRSMPRGHFSRVPASFGYFVIVMVWLRRWIFAWWFVNLERVNPNYSSHSSDFDAAWLIRWTASKYRAYTLESLLFLENFKRGVLIKKKTLQEPLSVQVDLNQGIKEGLILLLLLK